MYHTTGASHHYGDRQRCLRGTRKGILLEVEQWLRSEREQPIFWLNGLAGTGKSTIAQTFAEMAFAEGKLGASFFCLQGFEGRSNLQAIFPTLAFQLAYQYPLFRKKLLQVLEAHPDVRQESLCSQMEKLIIGPIKAAHTPTLIIIDALDECKDEQPVSVLLSILSRYVNMIPNVKFFVTGQPEPQIHSGFRLRSLFPITETLRFYNIEPREADSDIKLYLQTKLTNLGENQNDYGLAGDWPSSSDVEILCMKAAGIFIYASTVVKFVTSKNHEPAEVLNQIISIPQSTYEGKSGIDLLYTWVLGQIVNGVHRDNKNLHTSFRDMVGIVSLVFNPLSVKALSDLLKESNISAILHSLDPLFSVPINEVDPVHIFHKSFLDFLMDPERCQDKQFFVEPTIHHTEILLLCFNLMQERLKKNICDLDDHAILSEIEDLSACQRVHIGEALEYACCFWTKHLLRISNSGPLVEKVQREVDRFFMVDFLHWIEVLALIGSLDVGVCAMGDIEQWYTLVSGL